MVCTARLPDVLAATHHSSQELHIEFKRGIDLWQVNRSKQSLMNSQITTCATNTPEYEDHGQLVPRTSAKMTYDFDADSHTRKETKRQHLSQTYRPVQLLLNLEWSALVKMFVDST